MFSPARVHFFSVSNSIYSRFKIARLLLLVDYKSKMYVDRTITSKIVFLLENGPFAISVEIFFFFFVFFFFFPKCAPGSCDSLSIPQPNQQNLVFFCTVLFSYVFTVIQTILKTVLWSDPGSYSSLQQPYFFPYPGHLPHAGSFWYLCSVSRIVVTVDLECLGYDY